MGEIYSVSRGTSAARRWQIEGGSYDMHSCARYLRPTMVAHRGSKTQDFAKLRSRLED
jgi:hypothetical protein